MICSNCGTENLAGREVLHGVRDAVRGDLPELRRGQPARGQVLLRVRHAACAGGAARGQRPPRGQPPPRRDAGPDAVAERRLVTRPVRRPRRLHAVRRGPRRRGGPRAPDRYFETVARDHRPLRRHRREVHRRRGHGRLGRPDRPRGRRRARRPRRRSSSSTRSAALGPGHRGPGRRPDRRGGGHARRDQPGHGRRRPGQHGQPAPERGAARRPSSSARRPSAPPAGAIVFEAAGDQVLKGKVSPVPAWRALRVVAERGGVGRSRGARGAVRRPRRGAAPAQGPVPRHRPRRPAAARVASSARPASARSRLAWEFLKYIDGLVERVWWHDGRSPAYGEGISFWALGEMIRGRAGLPETDDEATTRARDRRDARRARPRRRRAALDRAGAAVPARASSRRVGSEQLFGAWRTFFERLAATGAGRAWSSRTSTTPTRACSTSSTTCSSGAGASRSYIVTLARPELLERRPDWGAGKRSFTSIYLEPLPERGDARAARRPRARPADGGRATRSSPAPTASRSTRSRRSGCSLAAGPARARRTASTARSATSTTWPCPRR